MAGTIMLVEDEQSIAALVRSYLDREGHHVVWVRSGEEALVELSRHPVRLIVLDVGLPGIDGFEVCRQVRARSPVPIIMLTARDEEADRVAGLEVGADDYVPKPFSPRELVARIKAVLRRVEPKSREDVLRGRDVAHLMENAGVVLSRDVLLDRVWGMEYPGETRTVDVHVGQLRKKLGRPDLIRTVRGAGYKVVRP